MTRGSSAPSLKTVRELRGEDCIGFDEMPQVLFGAQVGRRSAWQTRISHQDLAVFRFSFYNQCIGVDLDRL